MFINANSILITANGETISGGDYITEAKYGYNKLWSNDTGRNLAGVQSGTLIGIFPKIILQFRALTQTELEKVVKILDSANQSFTYYDPFKKANVTMTTYTGDYEITNTNIIGNDGAKNDGFSVSFIATSKRV